jgi:uridine monophosphate synthetase
VNYLSKKGSIIAKILFKNKALKFGAFKLKSGISSPFYIDLSRILSTPKDFEKIVDMLSEKVKSISSKTTIDKLVSIELKGALFLPSISIKTRIPCVIVRKQLKKYGISERIVGGEIKKCDRILFFDELITKGTSIIEGLKTTEAAGGKVKSILVILDREQGGRKNLEKLGYKFESITTISKMLNNLSSSGIISVEKTKEIENYLKKDNYR